MKTQLQLLCNRTFKTHTQDEMHIEFHKIHLAYRCHGAARGSQERGDEDVTNRVFNG